MLNKIAMKLYHKYKNELPCNNRAVSIIKKATGKGGINPLTENTQFKNDNPPVARPIKNADSVQDYDAKVKRKLKLPKTLISTTLDTAAKKGTTAHTQLTHNNNPVDVGKFKLKG